MLDAGGGGGVMIDDIICHDNIFFSICHLAVVGSACFLNSRPQTPAKTVLI